MNKWFNSKFFFFFWMLLALLPMKYVFNVSAQMESESRAYKVEVQEQSSNAPNSFDMELYNNDPGKTEYNDTPEQVLLEAASVSDEEYNVSGAKQDPYALSLAQLDFYEETLRGNSGLPSNSPIDFSTIADDVFVNYEDVAECSAGKNKNRGNVEAVLVRVGKTNAALTEAMTERKTESAKLPRRCVTHVMNKYRASPSSLARCPGGMGTMPTRGGAKPCVSKNLVNLTYNHFVDVAECLNIEPKDLLPKLSNESGMLINSLGGGWDAGIGQLTQPAIEEINKHYDRYIAEMEKAAIKKPSCMKVMQYKGYLKKTKDTLATRCSLIAPPDNPMKNIVYMGIYNRLNLDNLLGTKYIAGDLFTAVAGSNPENPQLVAYKGTTSDHITGGRFGNNQIQEKLARLGLKDVSLHNIATMVAFNGYNAGPSTAFSMLNVYLNERIKYQKPLKDSDFDFYNTRTATDIDGQVRSVTEIARLFIRSAFIRKNDPDAKIKLQRVKLLPEKIKKSYLLTFPEYVIYNQNNFSQSILYPENLAKVNAAQGERAKARERAKYEKFSTIGSPGYLSHLASKDAAIRAAFENAGSSKFYCSNPNFLQLRNVTAAPPKAPAKK